MRRPFYCGSQYADWEETNCMECRKGTIMPPFTCDIQEALLEACFTNGEISDSLWRRMGHDEKGHLYVWRCPEFEH
jgi:hypothetical protein